MVPTATRRRHDRGWPAAVAVGYRVRPTGAAAPAGRRVRSSWSCLGTPLASRIETLELVAASDRASVHGSSSSSVSRLPACSGRRHPVEPLGQRIEALCLEQRLAASVAAP